MAQPQIKRALLSVYDKTGLVDFARALHAEFGIELISTGGTARALQDAGLPVTLVEDVTGFPELMDGRVKTLHPKIHAAILADRDNPEHMRQLAEQGIQPIDMVVVNLYPFEETIAKPDVTFAEAIEMIDIGGPCLLRAAAKNHKHVWVVSSSNFEDALNALRDWEDPGRRQDALEAGALGAFIATALYDGRVSEWVGRRGTQDQSDFIRHLHLFNRGGLRYGENPHQSADLTRWWKATDDIDLTVADVVEDRPSQSAMSFNNYVDANAALELCAELSRANLWHRRPAGDSDQPSHVAPGTDAAPGDVAPGDVAPGDVAPGDVAPGDVAPASRRWKPISEAHTSRRNLPHSQYPGATYFVTFRVRQGQLSPQERDLVLDACRYWHGRKMNLHIATVMPDHVHLLLTPFLDANEAAVSLTELTHSIKSYSAHQIQTGRRASGPLWQDESWDRIIRHEREFVETWEYIETNAERGELGENYRWVFKSDADFEESGWREDTDHRRDAGATVCFIKHTNACGAAVGTDPSEVYKQAYLGDPNAAMGGILAVNFPVDAAFAEVVLETYKRFGKPLKDAGHPHPPGAFFVEVWIAPSFTEEAVRIIRGEIEGKPQKAWGQRVRLLSVGNLGVAPDSTEQDMKRIAGGLLMQTRDLVGLNEDQWQVASERHPTDQEWDELRLAWLVCKHTKSNAITICKDGMLIGNGAGQMSRVMSCRIATWAAKDNGHELPGAVAASDAFFPFRDGPDILLDAGVTALIQPGGSKNDEQTIAACNERGAALVFTGTRHFRH